MYRPSLPTSTAATREIRCLSCKQRPGALTVLACCLLRCERQLHNEMFARGAITAKPTILMFHGAILHGRVFIACNGFKLLQGFLFFALAYNGYNIHQENPHPATVERFWYHNAHHWQSSEAEEMANHSPWTCALQTLQTWWKLELIFCSGNNANIVEPIAGSSSAVLPPAGS